MLLAGIAVWVAGFLLAPSGWDVQWCNLLPELEYGIYAHIVSFLCYVAVAALLGNLMLFGQRVRWLATLFLWLVAVSLSLHTSVVIAFSTLLFMVAVAMLFACQPGEAQEGRLYTAFAFLGLAILLLPQFALLLPMFVAYMFIVNVFGFKRLLAAILGLATPFWLLYGGVYVFPDAEFLLFPFIAGVEHLFDFDIAEPTVLRVLLLIMELSVLLPAAAVFASSSVPGKPLLRRRLLFLMLTNIFLLLLSWLSEPLFALLYAWRMPGIAVFASYMFQIKVNKAYNIYFIYINILLSAVAAVSVWVN